MWARSGVEPRAVLVTGASSGIGRRLTERLAHSGWFVFAGARKQRDLRALDMFENVQALRLDVTEEEDIAAAAAVVGASGRALYGLVNNAGIVTLGPVLNGNAAEFDLVMRVNVYGPYRVTRAFAPAIIAARGRIVMISSVAGVLAAKGVSAYSMTKHAIEAFTDSLAEEMEPLGVQVSVVEPGTFHTRIGENALERLGPEPLVPDFSRYDEPDAVVDAIVAALAVATPRRRYLVVPSAAEGEQTLRKQMTQLVELNGEHRYSYSRDQLVQLLDEEIERAHGVVGSPKVGSESRQRSDQRTLIRDLGS